MFRLSFHLGACKLASPADNGKWLSPKTFLNPHALQLATFYAIFERTLQAAPALCHARWCPSICDKGLSFDESLSRAPDKCNVPASECFERRSATEGALRGGEELKLAPTR